jgi:hypothetical protein
MRPHNYGTDRVGFSKQDACGNLVVASLPVNFPLFRLLPKVSGANDRRTERESCLSYSPNSRTDTFLCDLGLANLCSTAQVWNPQEIS